MNHMYAHLQREAEHGSVARRSSRAILECVE